MDQRHDDGAEPSVESQMLELLPDRLSRYRVRDLEILYCNSAWAAGHGATPAEMIGRHLDEILTPAEMEGLRAQMQRLDHDQPLLPDTEPRPAPEDAQRWIMWVDRLLPGTEGDEVLSIGRDVTDRELAVRERAAVSNQLDTTMALMADGIIALDAGWHITAVNPAAAAMMHREAAPLLGRDVWGCFPYLAGTGIRTAFEEAVASGTPSHTDRIRDEHLDTWFEIDGVPTARGLVVFLRDVSARVRREQALERAIATEQQAVESLRRIDRVKTAFLSAVSHELRTPFTVVYGLAQSLQRLRGSLSEGERRELEDALVGQTERVRGLLDDLLDVDRLARGAVHADRAPVEVVDIATGAIARWGHTGSCDLIAPAELWVSVDAVQVERIVTNLLENAAKYAPGGHVEVRLATLAQGDGLRIDAVDDGPGIPTDELERVFEPFHRVDDDHPQPGTGIGLALVAEFARIHGGRAWAEDTGGAGAHIVVELCEEGTDGPTAQGGPS